MITLIKKPPEERTNKDFEQFQACAQNNHFLQTCLDRSDEAFGQELFNRLEYSYTPAGEVLFEAGNHHQVELIVKFTFRINWFDILYHSEWIC